MIKLELRGNKITEIKGVETLTNLEELHLEFNQIEFIKGFGKLEYLNYLNLQDNKISEIEGFHKEFPQYCYYLHLNHIYSISTKIIFINSITTP